MINDSQGPTQPEVIDNPEVQESVVRLDRSTSWFWWNSVAVITLAVLALAVLLSGIVINASSLPYHIDATPIACALLIFVLFLNTYTLYHQRNFKLFRRRFAEQMRAAAEQRMRADKFYGLSILDALTGLYNRRFGEERLQEEVMRAERNGDELAVVVFDLNNFKEINDEFGHACGDLVLKEFSRRLKRAIRACDIPVRIGGDEFLLVLPECARDKVPIVLARLEGFEVVMNHRKVAASCSLGHAQYQVGDTPQSIVERADKALYEQKAARAVTGKRKARVLVPQAQ